MISICFLNTPTMLRVIICATTPIPPRTICRSKNDLSKQVRSPGIIFVVEAEAFSVDIISNTDTFKKRFSDALTDKGFNLVGAEANLNSGGREKYCVHRSSGRISGCKGHGGEQILWVLIFISGAVWTKTRLPRTPLWLWLRVESKAPPITSYR
jgi:hypothetical protein